MPRKAAPMPPESVRDWLIVKDGWLYWNPDKIGDNRYYDTTKPIRYKTPSKQPTVKVEGRYYSVARLLYWYVHNDWPECVIHLDADSRNNHIDNLKGGTSQQSNFVRKFDKRTYSVTEYVRKNGTRSYSISVALNYEHRTIGTFDTEAEAVATAIAYRKLLHGDFVSSDIKSLETNLH